MRNLVIGLCLLNVVNIFDCSKSLVKISSGYLQGFDTELINGRLVHSFLGIPYAVPPVSNFRFKEPQPYSSWTGIWNCTTYSKMCIQYNSFMQMVVGEEDCLYVNVFTPKLPKEDSESANLMDVVVWFHGGSFIYGTGNYLIPEYLLAYHDVVFVSVNYRLGSFGFLSTDDDVVPGNNGLKDQVLALRWVQTNIKKFGGNPESVTIAGCSAGASSVHFHILSQASQGLFQKAIMHSGTSLQPWLMMGNVVPQIGKQLADLLGCPSNASQDMVDCLRERPSVAIAALHPRIMVWRHLGRQFGPVIEPPGKDRFLNDSPIALLRKVNRQIPCLMGVVADEGLVGLHNFIDDERVIQELDSRFAEIAPYLLYYYCRLSEEEQQQLTKEIRHRFFQNGRLTTKENYKKLVEMLGDRLIRAYVEFAIRLYALGKNGPIYYFQFNYTGQYSTTNKYTHNLKSYGVSHGDDMLYILRPEYHFRVSRREDVEVSKLMSQMWASFLKNGEPDVNINWPPVDEDPWKTGYTYLRISNANDFGIATHKDASAFDFWNKSLNEFPAIELHKFRDEL